MCIKNFCLKYNILSHGTNNNCRVGVLKSKKKWEKTPVQWKKLNFDAAFDKETKTCGIGLILRNCAVRCLEAMVKVTKAIDSEQAEGLALLEDVEWIKTKAWNNIIIEDDCKTIIEAVTSNFGNILWQDHNLLSDISRIVESLSNVECTFIPRTSNEAADGIAKYAKKYDCNQVWS
ncbi:uncharacterized protein LOC113311362 [Papaver somniferum]|uniref:uncharacterized protein LOC113311362 n=1 Tax=Papaver somniferum TaxID=3469 RepID=UPI000E705280|nr:uncharacterized protein LOC113311362 [Papaver somniferum]